VTEAVRAGAAREVLLARGARPTEGLRDLLAAADRAHVPVREVDRRRLDQLAPDHRGVVARLRAAAAAAVLGERDLDTFPFAEDAIAVILDGIEDPQNLGAAARSAEAAGAQLLVTRTRRSAPISPAAVRASAGALSHLAHARVANLARAIERLQGLDFTVIGLDERAPVTVYEDECPPDRVALVLGGEGAGLSRLVRERCDRLVSLPMRGRVGSLNAAASLAAALYAYVLPRRQAR
jgi:23S rRNA (guanosine2251-2'-O)-methyltransferase